MVENMSNIGSNLNINFKSFFDRVFNILLPESIDHRGP